MPGQNDFVDMMRTALAVSEPELDTTIGTTVRKILDAVAAGLAAASVDKYLLDYQYDLDAKTGSDLEDFVRLFGYTRLPARRASGIVRFERQTAATANVIIPKGTQVTSESSPPVVAFTVVPAVLMIGQTQIEVPVQAVVPGIGGNAAANTMERAVQPVPGISSFSNPAALTGGIDAESDGALRTRFRRTIFRNLAGTEQMFLGVALENDAVSLANVVGASKRRREQVEIVGGVATSTVQDATSVYAGTQTFGAHIAAGDILTPGVHYDFDFSQVPPVINVLDHNAAPDGIYELEFEYLPIASRNEPGVGITNRVDVYVNGVEATEAIESRVYSNSIVFNNAIGSPYNIGNYQRTNGQNPVVGNYFLALGFAPVLDPAISNTIVIGPTTYVEGIDFFLVNDVTDRGGAPQSFSGIEWVSVANGATQPVPANGTQFSADYTYNAVPREVEIALREWRLVTQDVWVHQAKTILLNVYLAVILESGYSLALVQGPIELALAQYVSNVGFDGVFQASDVLQVVHNVPGVDAVRFVTSSDDPLSYGIVRVATDGVTVIHNYAPTGRPQDVLTGDDEIVAINSVSLVAKAQNTFGVS